MKWNRDYCLGLGASVIPMLCSPQWAPLPSSEWTFFHFPCKTLLSGFLARGLLLPTLLGECGSPPLNSEAPQHPRILRLPFPGLRVRMLFIFIFSKNSSLFSPDPPQPRYPYSNLFQMLGNLHSPAQHEKHFPSAYQPLEKWVFSSLPANHQVFTGNARAFNHCCPNPGRAAASRDRILAGAIQGSRAISHLLSSK